MSTVTETLEWRREDGWYFTDDDRFDIGRDDEGGWVLTDITRFPKLRGIVDHYPTLREAKAAAEAIVAAERSAV